MARNHHWGSLFFSLFTSRQLCACLLVVVAVLSATPRGFTDSGPIANEIQATARIEQLRAEIAYHDDLYFRRAAPVITDEAYDELKQELARLEVARRGSSETVLPELERATDDDRDGRFVSLSHRAPMLSLAKAYSEKELNAFCKRVEQRSGRKDLEYVIEPKYDGVAISVTYEKGKLIHAVTRGDGRAGDDVTANVLTIASLPRSLRTATPPGLVELRGEVYVTFAEFQRVNGERAAAGDEAYANPRNLAAGTIKLSAPGQLAGRNLSIVLYGIGACEPRHSRPGTQRALLTQLKAWGLPTIDDADVSVVSGCNEVLSRVELWGSRRSRVAFPIDGVVVKINDVAVQELLGTNARTPDWAVAYKFGAQRAVTRLRGVTWQVGRTGVLTPVGELDPVRLDGALISRATLFNADEIQRLGLRTGDFVFVEKAGEVIPRISGVDIARARIDGPRSVVSPTECPGCGGEVVRFSGEVAIRCVNSSCPAQLERGLMHFVSRGGMGISGFGPKIIGELVRRQALQSLSDLYRLTPGDLDRCSSLNGTSAARLLVRINQSKQVELWRFVYALGIPQIGETSSRRFALRIDGLGALAGFDFTTCRRADSAGHPALSAAAVSALASYFAQPANQRLIADFISAGVAPTPSKSTPQSELVGKVFVFTGTLSTLSRAQASDRVLRQGAIVSTKVSKETDWLVVGEKPEENLEVAKLLGVVVLSEAEFLQRTESVR